MDKKMTVAEYLANCQTYCAARLADPSFFGGNDLQRNALRVEVLRDMSPRCGEKMPEHWHEEVKQRGWGIWIFSGGTAEVFGSCTMADCPRKAEFLRSAPYKHIRTTTQETPQ